MKIANYFKGFNCIKDTNDIVTLNSLIEPQTLQRLYLAILAKLCDFYRKLAYLMLNDIFLFIETF